MKARRVARHALPVIVALGLGVTVGLVYARVTSTTVTGSDVSPGQLLVSADQRTLAGSVGGSCASGYLKVTESADSVTVVLHRSPTIMIAPGSCAIETFVAHLKAPLGRRHLVDGITDATLPAFRGTSILRPTYVPLGFIHRYDTAMFPDERVSDATAGCVQVYTQDGSYDEAIWVSQLDGATWSPPEGVSPQPVTVRGQPGLAVPGELEWTEHGQLIIIESRTYAYATLSTAELVRMAESLQ